MSYFGFLNDLTRLLGIKRSFSINSRTVISFSILSFGTPKNGTPIPRYGFFRKCSKEDFFWLVGKEANN
jgi:hypothetical protein